MKIRLLNFYRINYEKRIFMHCLKKTANAATTDAETREKIQRVMSSELVQRVQRITDLRAFINAVRELPQPVADTLLQYPQMEMPCVRI